MMIESQSFYKFTRNVWTASLIIIQVKQVQKSADNIREGEIVGLWLSEQIPDGALKIWRWSYRIIGWDEDRRQRR